MTASSRADRLSRVLALVAAVAGILAIAQPGRPEREPEPVPFSAPPLERVAADSQEGKKTEAESVQVGKAPATMPARASHRRPVTRPDTTAKSARDSAAEEALPARACFQ